MIDFSQPGYPAREHAGREAFNRRILRQLKRAAAPQSEERVKSAQVEPKSKTATKPSRADRLYRKKAVR